jgi:hypothetical protein
MSISPTFTGAEPNVIDENEHSGTELLRQEGILGLELMQSLPVSSQKQAQTYKHLRDPSMLQTGDLKSDRWNHDDQRHLCGAFRDNRIVPNEGSAISIDVQYKHMNNLRLQVFGFLHSRQSRRD